MTSLGPWDPLAVDDVVALFADAPFRWWLCGGLALERFVGRSWRAHDDIDVGVLRGDVVRLVEPLAGWDVHVAAAGTLSPWNGRSLPSHRGENNLWCRRSPGQAWCLDLTINEGDVDHWIHRRHPGVRVTWAQAVLLDGGIPFLAPELQLSFKADRRRPKDDQDAEEVIPHLGPEARGRLRGMLDRGHSWQVLLT